MRQFYSYKLKCKMNRLNKSSQAYLEKRLNFRYSKVISDVENNRVDNFTRTLVNEYNEMVLDNPKYQSRMLLILK